MICEKCGKVVGYYEDSKNGNKKAVYTAKTVVCPKCGAVYCKECANKMDECECCGAKIKK